MEEIDAGMVMVLKGWQITLIIILAIVAAAGLWAAFTRYSPEHGWVERSAIPWGLMVPSYVFFASSAAGLAIIASLLILWRGSNASVALAARHMYVLAFSLLIPAWIIVFEDLGRPEHGFWILAGWNPTSRIAWMPVFYGLLALPMLALLAALVRSKVANTVTYKFLAALVFAGAIGLEYNLGQVFGCAIGIPSLHDARLGLLFAATAVGLGGAWSLLILPKLITARDGDRVASDLVLSSSAPAVIAAALVAGFTTAWLMACTSLSEPLRALVSELTSSSHAIIFYGVEIGLGYIAAPLLALYALVRKYWPAASAAAVAALVAGFAEKYGLILGSQLARLNGLVFGAITNPYKLLYAGLEYHVEVLEAVAVIGAVALGFLVFILIELFVALGPNETPRRLLVLR